MIVLWAYVHQKDHSNFVVLSFMENMVDIDKSKASPPIGMMECWNIGKSGFGILECWVNGPPKAELENLERIISFENPSIPALHYSVIPRVGHKLRSYSRIPRIFDNPNKYRGLRRC